MRLLLLIIIIFLLIGALPTWPYSSGWGYYPAGGLGTLLIILLILALFGVLWPWSRRRSPRYSRRAAASSGRTASAIFNFNKGRIAAVHDLVSPVWSAQRMADKNRLIRR